MSNFKAGDRVRVKSAQLKSYWYADKIGEVFTIRCPSSFGWSIERKLGEAARSLKEEDIELVTNEWVDGIPPVGAICEAWYSSRRDWCEAEVLKVDSDEHDTLIAARELDTDYLFWSHDFRPLKTQEEIEREEAIAEMRDDILNHEYTEASLEEYLIDLGWKKK